MTVLLPAYAIGATSTLVSLDSLGIPIPKASPVDYALYLDLGNLARRGLGYLTCEWRWSVLTVAQLTALEAYVGECYVHTLEYDGGYGVYTATLVLPPRKPPKVDYYVDYAVTFRGMAAVT